MTDSKPRRPAGIDPELLDEAEVARPRKYAFSATGMAATQHFCATDAAREMLEAGGNAVDAAVAAALALGVCEPAASGLGGQTMMLIRRAEPRKTLALDGSSRAPNRATSEAIPPEDRARGYRATTVPSTPAVLAYALERYGTVPWSRALEPAIRLAEEGYPVTPLQNRLTRRERRWLAASTAGPLFLKDGRLPYAAGTVFRQPILAKTLRRLAREGVEDFYLGKIARSIERDMIAHDGLIRRDDLARIPWPIERRPLRVSFGPWRVATFPPPGAGRTLVEMLNVLQDIPERYRDPDRPEGAAVLAMVILEAFRDRRDRPFDPNYFPQVEEKVMTSPEYARRVARRILRRIRRGGETTHLSVMDSQGGVVSLTQSIERVYGARVATPELGFLYNDYISAFEYEDMTHPYYLRPNGVPWASVAPTIVFRGRRPLLAIGSPGSDRITPSIVQVLLRLDRHSPMEAVDAPRLHCTLDGTVHLEAARMRDDIPAALERLGFTLREREPYSFYMGCVQLVRRIREGFEGVADPRRDGSASGPRRGA